MPTDAPKPSAPKEYGVGNIVQHMHGQVGEILRVFKSGGNVWLTVRWFDKRKSKSDCMLKSITKIIP